MKLTPFTRILIAIAIVAGLFFAVRALLPQLQQTGEKEIPTVTTEESTVPAVEKEMAPPPASDSRPGFHFSPPAPQNGKLMGVVELGASGFNSFIIRADPQDNWELEKAEYGVSLVYENMATENDIRAGLKEYISQMLNFGVAGKDIHFVVSSGAQKAENVEKITNGLKSLGYVVNPVTPTREAQLAFKCVLPEAYADRAFVVDIGSGNTKISWLEDGKVQGRETHGSKFYQDGLSDEQVYQEVKALTGSIPSNRDEVCFIIGGVPFELAKQIRQGDERYTVLKAPDAYTPEGEKQKAGLTIYKAIADATGCETFVFDWDANFTIGFLLSL